MNGNTQGNTPIDEYTNRKDFRRMNKRIKEERTQ